MTSKPFPIPFTIIEDIYSLGDIINITGSKHGEIDLSSNTTNIITISEPINLSGNIIFNYATINLGINITILSQNYITATTETKPNSFLDITYNNTENIKLPLPLTRNFTVTNINKLNLVINIPIPQSTLFQTGDSLIYSIDYNLLLVYKIIYR